MENFDPNFYGGFHNLLVAADTVESPPRKKMGKEQGIILYFIFYRTYSYLLKYHFCRSSGFEDLWI